jgi:hypothetical protein
MARPTGMQSRSRRIPLDVDDAIQTEAIRRGLNWIDELRRVYLREPEAHTVTAGPSHGAHAPEVCTCAKPTLAASSGMTVCTICHLPRRR